MSKHFISLYNLKKSFLAPQKEVLIVSENLQIKKDYLNKKDDLFIQSYEGQQLFQIMEDLDIFIEEVKKLEWIISVDKNIKDE